MEYLDDYWQASAEVEVQAARVGRLDEHEYRNHALRPLLRSWGWPSLGLTGIVEHPHLRRNSASRSNDIVPDYILEDMGIPRFVLEAKSDGVDFIQLATAYQLARSPLNAGKPSARYLHAIQANLHAINIFGAVSILNTMDTVPAFEVHRGVVPSAMTLAALSLIAPGVDVTGEQLHHLCVSAIYQRVLATHDRAWDSPGVVDFLHLRVHNRHQPVYLDCLRDLARWGDTGPTRYTATYQNLPDSYMQPYMLYDAHYDRSINVTSWKDILVYAFKAICADPVGLEELVSKGKPRRGALQFWQQEYEPLFEEDDGYELSGRRRADFAGPRHQQHVYDDDLTLVLGEIFSGPRCMEEAGALYERAGIPGESLIVEYGPAGQSAGRGRTPMSDIVGL